MSNNHKALDDFIVQAMEKASVPGVSVGILHDGETYTAGYGITNVNHLLEVTDETLFLIGSIAKTYAATVIMRLVERGVLDLDVPSEDRVAADVVLGQPDFYSEGPQAGGRGPEKGLYLPTGVGVFEGKLFVGDAWNHRVLVWNEVPETSDVLPDYVLGQANFSDVKENRGGEISALGMYWPYGINYINGWFYVTDTGNRRLLGWRGLPEAEQAPDLIMGQDSPQLGLENRGAAAVANSFRWPHDIAGTDKLLYVADAGNHRILGWTPPPTEDRPADLVIGQPDFNHAGEWPYGPQGQQLGAATTWGG